MFMKSEHVELLTNKIIKVTVEMFVSCYGLMMAMMQNDSPNHSQALPEKTW